MDKFTQAKAIWPRRHDSNGPIQARAFVDLQGAFFDRHSTTWSDYQQKGNYELTHGQCDLAVNSFSKAIASTLARIDTHGPLLEQSLVGLNRAVTQIIARGTPEKALSAYDVLEDIDLLKENVPKLAVLDMHQKLALANSMLANFDTALNHLDTIVQHVDNIDDPDKHILRSVQLNRGLVLMNQGAFQDAEKTLANLLQDGPSDSIRVFTLRQLAHVYEKQDEEKLKHITLKQAYICAEALEQPLPTADEVALLEDYSKSLLQQQDYEEAVEVQIDLINRLNRLMEDTGNPAIAIKANLWSASLGNSYYALDHYRLAEGLLKTNLPTLMQSLNGVRKQEITPLIHTLAQLNFRNANVLRKFAHENANDPELTLADLKETLEDNGVTYKFESLLNDLARRAWLNSDELLDKVKDAIVSTLQEASEFYEATISLSEELAVPLKERRIQAFHEYGTVLQVLGYEKQAELIANRLLNLEKRIDKLISQKDK